ncbi:hypothetical protein AB0M79_14580 [Polymorphospora sp. NPDC051019]|uniref:hypothetical protein n=1 Tax=Polymorphospora sp. NPDC051019 TaxID=3155725 RepID=UPI00343BD4DA
MPRTGPTTDGGSIPVAKLRFKLCVPVVLSIMTALAGFPLWWQVGLLTSAAMIAAVAAAQGGRSLLRRLLMGGLGPIRSTSRAGAVPAPVFGARPTRRPPEPSPDPLARSEEQVRP